MSTFSLTRASTVHVYSAPVSMGKSYKGLTELVEKKMKKKVMNGELYMFFNRKRTYVKVLFWDKTGMCILCKKLPHAYYDIEAIEGSTITLKEMQQCITTLSRKKPMEIEHRQAA